MNRKIVKKRLVLKKNIRQFLIRCMLTVIIVLITLIAIKTNNDIKKIITKNVYETNFKFGKAKELYQKYFGNILPIEKVVKEEKPVFNEKLTYKK